MFKLQNYKSTVTLIMAPKTLKNHLGSSILIEAIQRPEYLKEC